MLVNLSLGVKKFIGLAPDVSISHQFKTWSTVLTLLSQFTLRNYFIAHLKTSAFLFHLEQLTLKINGQKSFGGQRSSLVAHWLMFPRIQGLNSCGGEIKSNLSLRTVQSFTLKIFAIWKPSTWKRISVQDLETTGNSLSYSHFEIKLCRCNVYNNCFILANSSATSASRLTSTTVEVEKD